MFVKVSCLYNLNTYFIESIKRLLSETVEETLTTAIAAKQKEPINCLCRSIL